MTDAAVIIPSAARLIAGIDEAGRGPLAGPVIAAAVILDKSKNIIGLRDSKQLSAGARLRLAGKIREHSLCWATGRAEVEEIDTLNILQASLLAMKRAVEALDVVPDFALVDGLYCPDLPCRAEGVVKGDRRFGAISAASILAKVTRDEEMNAMDSIYPGYGFARHKGYPTADHIRSLDELGPCALHRRTFGPVRKRINPSPDTVHSGRKGAA